MTTSRLFSFLCMCSTRQALSLYEVCAVLPIFWTGVMTCLVFAAERVLEAKEIRKVEVKEWTVRRA